MPASRPAQSRAGQRHRLAVADVLIAEGGRAAGQAHNVRGRAHRSERVSTVAALLPSYTLLSAVKLPVMCIGSDVGGGGGHRVQHVVGRVGARQGRAGQGHRLAVADVLVAESRRAAGQGDIIEPPTSLSRARQHRRRVVAVVYLVVRREAAGDVLGIDDISDRRGGDIVVVGGARERPSVAVGTCNDVCRAAHVNGADGGSRLAVDTSDGSDSGRVRLAIVWHVVRRDHHRRRRLGDNEVPSRLGGQGVVVGRVIGHEVRRYRIGPRIGLGGGPAGENVRHRARHRTGGDANRGRLGRTIVGLRRVVHCQRRRWSSLIDRLATRQRAAAVLECAGMDITGRDRVIPCGQC